MGEMCPRTITGLKERVNGGRGVYLLRLHIVICREWWWCWFETSVAGLDRLGSVWGKTIDL
jgi:hypothetical protein